MEHRHFTLIDMSSSDSGVESENGHNGDAVVLERVADEQERDSGDPNLQPAEPQPQEREITLTDHLNKKLLQSFLTRLDAGRMDLPPGIGAASEEKEAEWEDS